MPWTPLILITVLFGVICGNSFMDNRLRNPYANAIKNAAVVDATDALAEAINTKSFLKILKESSSDRNGVGRTDNTEKGADVACKRYGSIDCIHQSDRLINGNMDLLNKLNANTETKRDFYETNSRDMRESTDVLSDIFAVDTADIVAPPPQQPAAAAVGDATLNYDLDAIDLRDTISDLPTSHYADFYQDLITDMDKEDVKRNGANAATSGCDCKIKNDLIDLGTEHFPRYLLNAICHTEQSPNEYAQKCWRGSVCKPLEYKVKVLTFRSIMDYGQKDYMPSWLPDDLKQIWKFKTVTVAAGCFCSY